MNLLFFSIVFLFGLFLIWSSYMMISNPEKVRKIIATAGSTYLINYGELSIRLLIGIAFVRVVTKYHFFYQVFGYFLIVSALILMLVPIKLHNKFSVNAANMLNPIYLKICAPFSFLGGILIIYGII